MESGPSQAYTVDSCAWGDVETGDRFDRMPTALEAALANVDPNLPAWCTMQSRVDSTGRGRSSVVVGRHPAQREAFIPEVSAKFGLSRGTRGYLRTPERTISWLIDSRATPRMRNQKAFSDLYDTCRRLR